MFRSIYDIIRSIRSVHKAFDSLVPTIKFTLETETDSSINFLDISIQNEGTKLLFNIPGYS